VSHAGKSLLRNLLVLCVHRVLAERLQMFPTSQHADVANSSGHHRKIASIAFAEHRAFDVRRLQLRSNRRSGT